MSEPTLELLQTMVQRVLDNQQRQARDHQEMRERLNETLIAVTAIRRDQAHDAEVIAHVQARMDRLGDRLDRVERRLDLHDDLK